jgi:hypothetical protein
MFKCQVYFGWRKLRADQDYLAEEVADDLSATMEISVVDDGVQVRAHIACCHHLVETYRGYLLYSNFAGHTFLIDTRTYTYVKESVTQHLLQFEGVDQAKRFVDELCQHLQMHQGLFFNQHMAQSARRSFNQDFTSQAVRFCISVHI